MNTLRTEVLTTEEADKRFPCESPEFCAEHGCRCTEGSTRSQRCPSCNGRVWQPDQNDDRLLLEPAGLTCPYCGVEFRNRFYR